MRLGWLFLVAILAAPLTLPATTFAAEAEEVDPAAEDAFFTGIALLEAGDVRGAIAKFDLALRIQPTLRRVLFYRARAWVRLGDVPAARRDAEAYAGAPLEAQERQQLDVLRKEIDDRGRALAEPIDAPPSPNVVPVAPGPTRPSGLSLLSDAETALARGDCRAAADGAAAALAADSTLSRSFLVKGLALECLGEPTRARDLLGTYRELRTGMPEDPVATAALARIEGALRVGTVVAAPPIPRVDEKRPLGKDTRITGILEERFGAPQGEVVNVKAPRKEDLPGVGPATVGIARMRLGGSAVRAERAWVFSDKGMTWTRLRVTARSGPETPDWYRRVLTEFFRSVERTAGAPVGSVGMKGGPERSPTLVGALAGRTEMSATWKDGDGDSIQLRAGRCTQDGDDSNFHPDTASCIEFVGSSGLWKAVAGDRKVAEAAHRMEEPGKRGLDFAVGLGAGFAPTVWSYDGAADPGFGGELNGDLLVRFAIEHFAFGLAANVGITGHSLQPLGDPPLSDARLLFQAGFRIDPLQRQFGDVVFGIGLASDIEPALAVSLRITAWVRTADLGRFHISFEPGFVKGRDSLTVVPFRFVIGAGMGTRSRLAR